MGGEEFTILFPGSRATSVLEHLESLRKSIESYKLMLRESERPHRRGPGKPMSNASGTYKWISVTISIGVAERAERVDPPEAVLTAADRALYRAKADGRNRVSR
jgi:diguanylate cyclase (GGDEF)-like protein